MKGEARRGEVPSAKNIWQRTNCMGGGSLLITKVGDSSIAIDRKKSNSAGAWSARKCGGCCIWCDAENARFQRVFKLTYKNL